VTGRVWPDFGTRGKRQNFEVVPETSVLIHSIGRRKLQRSSSLFEIRIFTANGTSTHSTSATSRYLPDAHHRLHLAQRRILRRPGRSDERGLFVSNSTCGACVDLGWRNQILLFKGKKVSVKGDTTLEVIGLSDVTEVQVLGSTVGGEKKRMEHILRNRDGHRRGCARSLLRL
jgi:hypothetical protein